MLRIKLTQMDKYLRPLKTRRIYTHTVLVTITQTNPDERTHRQKDHSVSPNISSSPTKVTQECSDTNTQRSGGNTHETYTFSNIWDTQETEYRHLVMQTKTTGKSQKQKCTCDDRKKMRQCTAKKPSTKDIVTACRIWHTYQNKKSSQVSYTNYTQTCYTRLGTNGQEVDPLLDGVLRVHFSLDSIRQQSVKSNPQSIIIKKYLENRGRKTTTISMAILRCRIFNNYGQNLTNYSSKKSPPHIVNKTGKCEIVSSLVKDTSDVNSYVTVNHEDIK